MRMELTAARHHREEDERIEGRRVCCDSMVVLRPVQRAAPLGLPILGEVPHVRDGTLPNPVRVR